MTGTVLLVDFENVQDLDLAKLPTNVRVAMFVGPTQTKVQMQLVEKCQPLGSRLQWFRVSRPGRNALDLHIAAYMGETFAREPHTKVVILSRDKDFDPLLETYVGRKFACQRVASIAEVAPPKAALGEHAKRMREHLGKMLFAQKLISESGQALTYHF